MVDRSIPFRTAPRLLGCCICVVSQHPATADFNATMKGALSPAQLQAAWQSLTPQAGAFKQVVASTSSVPYYSDALNETAARYEAGVIAHQLDLIPGRPDHYRSRY